VQLDFVAQIYLAIFSYSSLFYVASIPQFQIYMASHMQFDSVIQIYVPQLLVLCGLFTTTPGSIWLLQCSWILWPRFVWLYFHIASGFVWLLFYNSWFTCSWTDLCGKFHTAPGLVWLLSHGSWFCKVCRNRIFNLVISNISSRISKQVYEISNCWRLLAN